jgi:hypothetical protein
MKLTTIALAGFVLWISNDDQPAYRRGTYNTYQNCVVAGQAQVDSLRDLLPTVAWQCVPER